MQNDTGLTKLDTSISQADIINTEIINADVVNFAKAIADDTRQAIMKRLCCEWLSVNDVVIALGGRVNQPTVSHHLKLLSEAKLVHVRQEGRQRFYSLNQEYFTVCCGALMHNFAPNVSTRSPIELVN